MNGVGCVGVAARKVPKGRLKVAQDVVLGNDEQAGKSREGRLNNGAKFSAVPSGLPGGAFLTQDCVLGYFQTSLRDSISEYSLYTRRFCMVRITFPLVTAPL
jgi:hypothetical protein